jgi:hypothetical protein
LGSPSVRLRFACPNRWKRFRAELSAFFVKQRRAEARASV